MTKQDTETMARLDEVFDKLQSDNQISEQDRLALDNIFEFVENHSKEIECSLF